MRIGGFCGDRVRNRGVPEKKPGIHGLLRGNCETLLGDSQHGDTEVQIQEEGKEDESWRMRQSLSSEFISRGGEVEYVRPSFSDLGIFVSGTHVRVEQMQ